MESRTYYDGERDHGITVEQTDQLVAQLPIQCGYDPNALPEGSLRYRASWHHPQTGEACETIRDTKDEAIDQAEREIRREIVPRGTNP